MNKPKISIRLKIILLLAAMTAILVSAMYYLLQDIVKEQIYELEMQKAREIVKSIEPAISMAHFLEQDGKFQELGDNAIRNSDIVGLTIYAGETAVYTNMPKESEEFFDFALPVKDVVTQKRVGGIIVYYSKTHYYDVLHTIQQRIMVIAGFTFAVFIFVYFTIKHLLRPLEQIGNAIEQYSVGQSIDFSDVRSELETNSIVTLISDLIRRINKNYMKMAAKQHELTRAKNKAEIASRSKSMFLANMSHEIRTPLNAIMGFVDILSGMEKDALKSRYLGMIKNNSKNLLLIINDILDFSKIESGKLELEWHAFDPKTEFESLLSLFCSHCHDKKLLFNITIDPMMPERISSDALRIKQVLSNLLSNAVKFTAEGGSVSISIRYDKTSEGIAFSVEDTGIGISKENTEKIFEAFLQEDETTTRRFGGTGLGLSISHQLVRILGGELQLESSPDKGSRFFFTLPLSPDEEEAQRFGRLLPLYDNARLKDVHVGILPNPADAAKAETIEAYLRAFHVGTVSRYDSMRNLSCDILILDASQIDDTFREKLDAGLHVILYNNTEVQTSCSFSDKCTALDCITNTVLLYDLLGELAQSGFTSPDSRTEPPETAEYSGKVLIVEDNDANQMVLEVMMQMRGLDFDFAQNGAEAVDKYHENAYDLILMDENMPVMNGTEATRRILELEKEQGLEHTPIVAVTANAIKDDRKRFLEAGMDEYLSKPIDADKLDEILSRYLPKKTLREEARSTAS